MRRYLLQTLWAILAGAFLGLALGPSAWAAKAKAPEAAPKDPNEQCFMCHGDKDAKGSTGKSLFVDAKKFAASVHGGNGLSCDTCHPDAAKAIPHPEKLKPVDCGGCHEGAVKAYQGTVHGLARKGGKTAAATCVDCHGNHDIQKSSTPGSRTSHEKVEATCSGCHGNDARVAKDKLPGGNIDKAFHDSIHGKALAGGKAPAAPSCTNCHGAHDIRAKSDDKSHTSRANIPETCGNCHGLQKREFMGGKHGQLRQDGNLASPGCTDCHSAHSITSHTETEFHLRVTGQCGTCHNDKNETFRDTFHGQVTNLGSTRVADCDGCHGSHDIRGASDPLSKVSWENRVETCRACHPRANQNFAAYDPHASAHDPKRNLIYYWTGVFMKYLLIGVFSFFGLHTVLWLYRSLRDRAGRK